MISVKDIQIEKLEYQDNNDGGGIRLKTIRNNKEFMVHYSHVDITNDEHVTSVTKDFEDKITEYYKTISEALKINSTLTEEEIRENYFIDIAFRQRYQRNEKEKLLVDKFYLKRKVIDDVKYIITDTEIKVTCPGTVFINISPYREINIKELLQKRLEIIKIAKANNISISYKNKTKNKIDNYTEKYKNDIKLSQELYQKIKAGWEYIRDNRGLHSGLVDDYYEKEITELAWEFEKLNNRNEPIGIIDSLANNIEQIHDKLVKYGETNFYRIYL